MLPAPASIAAPPRAKSRVSRNPAVPPPPVAGAAVGSGLADGLGATDCAADGVSDGVSDGDPDGDPDGDSDAVSDGLALVLAVALAVPLGEMVEVGEVVPAGENEGDPTVDVDVEQAETAAEVSMVMMPQPVTVNIALSPVPAMVVRTFMEPPARSGRRQVPESADSHKGKAHGRHRHTVI
jgi:hypothetical protein